MGEDHLYPFLAWLEVHPVVMEREAGARGERFPEIMLSRWHHNQVGLCVRWALSFLPGRPATAEPDEEDRRAAFELARRCWVIKNVMGEVRQGARGFSARGRRIRIPFEGDVRLDAIDRFLDMVDGVLDVCGKNILLTPGRLRLERAVQVRLPHASRLTAASHSSRPSIGRS
jgi:hypothetical protein